MRKALLSLALPLLAALAFYGCSNAPKRQEAVSWEVENDKVPLADPFILLHDGVYYAYGTGEPGFRIYTSTDLEHWQKKGIALDIDKCWGTKQFWAPEVYYVKSKNKFFIFYSSEEHICVATADNPEGPFTQDVMKPIREEKGIDTSLFIDDDGTPYLYFVRFTGGNVIWVAEMTDDLLGIKEETLTECVSAVEPWETRDSKVAEGPSVFKIKGKYYLIYSTNHTRSQDYAVGYATASSPYGPWEKASGNPVLRKDSPNAAGLVGTGHGAPFKDKDGKSMYVFHAHFNDSTMYPRTMYIDKELKIAKDGTLSMPGTVIHPVVVKNPLNVIPAPKETKLIGEEAPVAAAERCRVRISKKLQPEEYILKVRRRSVRIEAGGPAGEFYARQTLAQEIDNQGMLLVGTIKDSPRFEWRGYMLDESRHFFGEEFVLKTLDLMAYYKLNKFHWHLTDAPGWRIEIKKYPELTTVGATGCYTDPAAPAAFYTQDQIRKIVAYAAERHIEVIPEFDMPGHASAACRAYPWLMGGMDPSDPNAQFTFNVGSEKVYDFISDVLDEIFSLFPSEYIHIGGDEVNFGSACWNDNPDIQALMKREGIEDLKQVEGWFLKKMAGVIAEKGHKLIAWDDVLDGGAEVRDAAIMWWRHERPDHLTQALDNGQKAILTPRRPLYLDFVQYPGHTQGRSNFRGEYVCCTLKDIHDFPEVNVAGVEFTPERLGNVLGIQGNLWTETVKTEERADHMSWPRLCAIAESGWTMPENKDFPSFESRMDAAFKHLEAKGIHYFDYRDPELHPEFPAP